MKKTYFFTLLFILITNVISFADPGGKSFKEAKDYYDKGQYREAIKLFEQAIIENPQKYNSKGNYMAGLCYKKLDACSEAKVYFRKSYEADPSTGGASSLDKFKDQLKYCKITLDELKTYTNSNPNTSIDTKQDVAPRPTVINPPIENQKPATKSGGFSFFWIVIIIIAIGAGGYYIYNKNKKSKEVAVENKSYMSDQLYNISEILFDDAVWAKYAEQYGEDAVQRIQSSWQLEYSQLVDSQDEVGVNQLLRKIRQLDASPASVFNSDKLL